MGEGEYLKRVEEHKGWSCNFCKDGHAFEKNKDEGGYDVKKIKNVRVSNGGVVFLYPFFFDVFKSLNFFDKRDFFENKVKINNAVHVVQFFSNFKFRDQYLGLELSKVLCGLDYDDKIFCEYIFNDDKGKALEELDFLRKCCNCAIQKCINEWEELSILKKFEEFKNGINIENFMDYFLKRSGVLNIFELKKGGVVELGYVLDLSCGIYDDEICGIPWDIEHVKNFWMKNELIVRNVVFGKKK